MLLAKSRLDAHDRGVRDLAGYLRETGMEVLLTRFGLPEEIGETALQEGVDLVGVSSSSGGHLTVARRLAACLAARGAADLPVLFGGIVPDRDLAALRVRGVRAVFGPGTAPAAIAATIRALADGRAR